jgi:prepilin-type N-terminal cleavage/methylation domain-containing protein
MDSKRRGFTLVELLIVIGVIAVLVAVVILVINPAQLLMQSRDSNRITALTTVNTAIAYAQSKGFSLGSPNVAYISIPDPTLTGNATSNCASLGLPAIASTMYQCVSSANAAKTDGTGWIPIALNATPIGESLGSLPLDPVNTTSSGEYYIYKTDGGVYELQAKPEAAKDISNSGFTQGTSLSLLNPPPQNIWVVDEGNSNIQEFDTKGNYITQFGNTDWEDGEALENPYGLAIDGSGNLYTITGYGSFYSNEVMEFSGSTGDYIGTIAPALCTGTGSSRSANGIAIDSNNTIYIPETHSGLAGSYYYCVAKYPNGTYSSQFGTYGSSTGQFNDPTAAAIDPDGNIWVVDNGNHRVEEFSNSGTYLSQFGTQGTGNGQFENPDAIAIDGSGNIYVVDAQNRNVQKFSSNGTYLLQFGTSGSGNGQFNDPTAIATDNLGNVWVVDSTLMNDGGRVEEFNNSGTYLFQFGTAGSGNGEFEEPSGIVIK